MNFAIEAQLEAVDVELEVADANERPCVRPQNAPGNGISSGFASRSACKYFFYKNCVQLQLLGQSCMRCVYTHTPGCNFFYEFKKNLYNSVM